MPQAKDGFLIKSRNISAAYFQANRRHLRWFVLGFMLPITGGFLAYSFAPKPASTPIPIPLTLLESQILDSPLSRAPLFATKPSGDIVEFVVGRNDTLERVFRQARLRLDDLAVIRNLPGMREALDVLRPGELITLTHIDGVLHKLTRRLSETQLLTVSRKSEGFATEIIDTPLDIRRAVATGVIDSSLFNAARAVGMSSEIILRMANDIFGWDIDFALDIQSGDKFSVVYERKYRDGHYLGDGQILAAEFVNEGRVYRAVRFQSADGEITDYFTPEGRSMRKQFLRAPVDFKYISSNFNPRRRHPILNITRAHQGVDYSAPTGTPVKAAGDGKVSLAGAKGGYGNAVILEHGGGISTLYGHLSRFATHIRTGSRVKQGDIVAYVGSTGTSTAPHLHYEYRINGIHKNPRTVSLPDAQPIAVNYVMEFRAQSTTLLGQLDTATSARLTAAPNSEHHGTKVVTPLSSTP